MEEPDFDKLMSAPLPPTPPLYNYGNRNVIACYSFVLEENKFPFPCIMIEVVVAAGICCISLYSAFCIRGRFRSSNIIL